MFLFSCSDSAKKENREFKNGVVYFNTSNSHFLNEKNGELFDKSRKLHSNKDYKGCLNILLKLKEEEPQNKLVLGSLGIVYLDLKEYDKSEKYLKGVTESHPDFFNNWINLSKLYISSKRFELAEETLIKIVDLEKTEKEELFYLLQRATVSFHLGNCTEALFYCEDAIRQSNDEWFLASAENAYEEIKRDCVEK